RKMYSLKIAAFNRKIARLLGSAGQKNRVVITAKLVPSDIYSDVDLGFEKDAFVLHLLNAAINQVLLKFEIGNAVCEKTADAVVFFKHRNGVTRAIELLRGGEARRTGADDRDLFARPDGGYLRMN